MTVVELRSASLSYAGPPIVEALRPSSVIITAGEYVTITGPSGSGKSTLLNLLGLLDRPTDGTYLLDGVDTGALPESKRTAFRAYHVGFVFQAFHLLPYRSSVENVMLGLLYRSIPMRTRRNAAFESLVRVGLSHRSDALASTLSGGERQRVAIARALAGQPRLLLCDEPTGNLDTATAEIVLGLIDELNRDGLTVIMITHDSGVAARGRRKLTIRDGILTE